MISTLEDFQREILSWSVIKALNAEDQIPAFIRSSDDEWLDKVLGRKKGPPLLPNRFINASEYKEAFSRPALLEFQAAAIQSLSESMQRGSAVRVNSSQSTNQPDSRSDFRELTLSVDSSYTLASDQLLIVSDSAHLKKAKFAVFGISLRSTHSSLRLRVLKELVGGLEEGGKYFVFSVISMTSASREFAALSEVDSIPLSTEFLLGSADALANHVPDPSAPKSLLGSVPIPPLLRAKLSDKFNPSQQLAIANAAGTDAAKLVLIKGPPGTGKTATLHAILNCMHISHFHTYYAKVAESVRNMEMSTDDRQWLELTKLKPRLLVCAPSNVAIDNIVARLAQDQFADGEGRAYMPSLVRVGRGVSEQAEVAKYSLDALVEKVMKKSGAQVADKMSRVTAKLAEFRNGVLQNRAKLLTLKEGTPYDFSPGFETRIVELKPAFYQVFYVDHNRKSTSTELPPKANIGEAGAARLEDMQEWVAFTKELTRYLELWEDHFWKLQRLKLAYGFFQRGSRPSERYQLRENLETLILNRATVVASTLNSSGLPQVKNSYPFSTLIVDEAAQAVELSTLIPLSLGVRRCILVGDPQQLPATVLAKREDLGNYERSLFERLQTCGVPVVTLNIQYRMHPAISVFPRVVFYQENSLLDAPGVKVAPFFAKPEYGIEPFTFFDLTNASEQISTSGSRSNPSEAVFCVNLYLSLLQISVIEGVDLTGKVGVITPYADQVEAIKSEFNAAFVNRGIVGNEVEVNTVDAYQGREKDIIILSTVRASSPENSIGFLADIRRMNVALTRAKYGLFVVGRCSALSADPNWDLLIYQAKNLLDVYIPVTPMEDLFSLYAKRKRKPPMPRVELGFLLSYFDESRLIRKALVGPQFVG